MDRQKRLVHPPRRLRKTWALSLYERKAADPRQDRAWLCATNYELLANCGELIRTFRGVVEGEMLEASRGTEGFGYDPLFYYPPYGRSFGEISAEEKMAVSHRGKALTGLFRYLG